MTVLTKRKNLSKTKTMYKSKSKTNSKKSKNISKSRKILQGGEKLISDELKNMKGGAKGYNIPKGSMSTGSMPKGSMPTGSMKKISGSMSSMPGTMRSRSASMSRMPGSVPGNMKKMPVPSVNSSVVAQVAQVAQVASDSKAKKLAELGKRRAEIKAKTNTRNQSVLNDSFEFLKEYNNTGNFKSQPNVSNPIKEIKPIKPFIQPIKPMKPTVPFITMHNTSIPIIFDNTPTVVKTIQPKKYTEINVNTLRHPDFTSVVESSL